MIKQEVSQADIAETFSKTLMRSGWVKKGELADENQWGVDVLYHKRESGKMMFHFITPDMLEINLEFDLVELNQRGSIYVDERIEILISQSNAAREERQRVNRVFIGYGNNEPIVDSALSDVKQKPVSSAISTAIEAGETIH